MSEKEQGLRGRYIDPRYQTAIAFNQTSPYLLPWRAYQETIPTNALTNALGVQLNLKADVAEPVLKHLAGCGIKHGRIEVGWGNLFEDAAETVLVKVVRDWLATLLHACRNHRVRPLILLNAHHGVPVPMVSSQRTLARPARKGDRVAHLTDVTSLQAYHSGFGSVSDYKAAEIIFLTVEKSGRVALARPLPKDLGDAGKAVAVDTLRYLPFGFPDAAENERTRSGWKRYAFAVARFAAQTLTPRGGGDRGFDMEIWNELSFGSDFVEPTRYFDPIPFSAPQGIWEDIIRATAEVATANAGTFAGVRLCDGFANTIPWTASSLEPARVSALSKHPYSSVLRYNGKPTGAIVNARFEVEEQPAFTPTYTAAFPEIAANALPTEHLVRDLSPITTNIGAIKHGRFARPGMEKMKPFRVWFTEWGMSAKDWGVTGREAEIALKARACLRMFVFMVGKGLERLYFYAAQGEDTLFGMVSERFIEHVNKTGAFPSDDAAYRSPVLAAFKRLTDAVAGDPGQRARFAPVGGGGYTRHARALSVARRRFRQAPDAVQPRVFRVVAVSTNANRLCASVLYTSAEHGQKSAAGAVHRDPFGVRAPGERDNHALLRPRDQR